MADYGIDVSTYPSGLDPTFAPLTGTRVLVEQILRMLETAEGTHDDDPEFAYLLADAINSPQTATSLAVLSGKIVSKIELDERVASADVTATFRPPLRLLVLDVLIVPVEGVDFRFVVGIDGVTVALLEGTI